MTRYNGRLNKETSALTIDFLYLFTSTTKQGKADRVLQTLMKGDEGFRRSELKKGKVFNGKTTPSLHLPNRFLAIVSGTRRDAKCEGRARVLSVLTFSCDDAVRLVQIQLVEAVMGPAPNRGCLRSARPPPPPEPPLGVPQGPGSGLIRTQRCVEVQDKLSPDSRLL